MSRHMDARDSRHSSSHRRRHEADADADTHTRHSQRDERERARDFSKQSRPSAASNSASDRHRNEPQPHRHQTERPHHHDQPHRRDRDRDRDHRTDRHMLPPAAVKREQSRSPDTKAKRHRNRYANDGDDGTHEWGKPGTSAAKKEADDDATAAAAAGPIEKELPNFGLSGKLSEDTNKVNGVVLKYSEPDEARKPKRRWRLYPFKGDEVLPTLYIHWQSCFLVGRDRKICDIPVDHPSCSKQHAVLQYRLVGYTRDDGTKGKRVRPYVLDLDSANGTYLNNQRIDARKYVEVLEKDVLKFGYSSREYVVLHENSKDEEDDDDVLEEATK